MLGVIFDWDGVVINSADLHEKSWEILAEEIGSPFLPIISQKVLVKEMKPSLARCFAGVKITQK